MEPQQYIPKPDNHDVNHMRRDSMTDIAILFVGTLAGFVVLFAACVLLLQLFAKNISVSTEQRLFSWLGDKMAGNSVKNEEMNALFEKLSHQQKLYNIRFTVSCDKQPNAFALPGGRITLTKGLLESIKSEEGLAFVLGHEIGHLQKRHHLRSLSMGFVSIVFSFVFSFDSSWIWETLQTFLSSAYSRDQESEADQYALALMVRIYGSVWGAEEFFESIKNRPEEKITSRLWMFNSHPVTQDRIDLMKNYPLRPERETKDLSKLFTSVVKEAC